MNSQKPSENSPVVSYAMPKVTGEYLSQVLSAAQARPEQLTQILQAMHHVAAGGRVEVKVVAEGNTAEVSRLDAQMAEAMRQSNEVNRRAGAYVTATI